MVSNLSGGFIWHSFCFHCLCLNLASRRDTQIHGVELMTITKGPGITWDELADQLAEELARIEEANGSREDKDQAYVRFHNKIRELNLQVPTVLNK